MIRRVLRWYAAYPLYARTASGQSLARSASFAVRAR
ncbi:hypothetical protein FHX53_002118 [Yonghaparkia alkaliphila]|uniref:Uncharacterized protein n=1 Tax=Microcella alkalica TaxID=355930 RepID=A0A839EE37_9MICO|nr:hypothetical protein [Microcella alkalica]